MLSKPEPPGSTNASTWPRSRLAARSVTSTSASRPSDGATRGRTRRGGSRDSATAGRWSRRGRRRRSGRAAAGNRRNRARMNVLAGGSRRLREDSGGAMSIVRRCFLGLLLVAVTAPAKAEQTEINVAQQFGVSFLPLMLMERDKLVEKHARAEGLSEVKVGWIKVAGPSVMNDGVISGALQFIAVGAPSMITLWDKTNGQVKGVSAMTTYPLYLITRDPNVKSVRDFSDQDKIAVPSIKVSTQAIMLQMLAAKEFGDANWA